MVIEINSQVSDLLGGLARREARTKFEILRRAIGLYSYLSGQVDKAGSDSTVAILGKDDKVLVKLKWL